MSGAEELIRALRAAEAEAVRAAGSSAEALAGVDRIRQTVETVAGRRPPAPLKESLAELDDADRLFRNAEANALDALAGIRGYLAELEGGGSAGSSASPGAVTSIASAEEATGGQVLRLSSSDPAHVRRLNQPPANATIVVDGRFRYETDEHGRVVKATATLETIDLEHPRSEHAQKTLSGKLPGDDAGHLFARIFKGPGQKINLAPMESLGVNRGEYGRLERLWREKIEAGERVEVEVRLVYSDTDERRPTSFRIRHRHTDGGEFARVWKRVNIDNTPAER
ncbi:DNA/RNA non-specific endonuclease [Nocardioides speluncae]|uniref:DNA/RNA non-specific endonuclease n=1 Tax=Nocardioides speluncae TaxID=2670337 RepID=UPI000D686A69|nr:DNA/RNA non-specific endonuclease [Nocardioides speluncae]